MRRRVVITGLGPVAASGLGAEAFWSALVEGRSGVAALTRFDPGGFPAKLAGEVNDLDARQYVPKSYRKATKVMARDIEIAVAAAKLAVDDAGLKTRGFAEESDGFAIPAGRFGCQIGAGLIAAETEELTRALATSVAEDGSWDLAAWGTEGDGAQGAMNNLPPLWLLKYLPNMLACHVTIVHGCEGPSNTITCAEASALLSIGEGARVIERGDADACLSGGAESKVNLMGMMRMHLAGRVGATGGASEVGEVCKPYDASSAGGVAGEGGGLVVIEEAEHAKGRGARVYAEVAGFAAAHSPAPLFPGVFDGPRPEPIDPGLRSAVERALKDAGVGAADVDAVVPLAAGAPELDEAEAGALQAVFGDRLGSVAVVPITPMAGNTFAGHGGLAVVAGAQMIASGRIPARVHAGEPAFGGVALDAKGPAKDADVRTVVVCAAGLGGQAAAVVLTRAE